MSQEPVTTRRRHLIDPTQPRKQPTAEDLARLHRVQRRVASVLILTTIFHLTVGFVVAAKFDVAGDRADAKVALVLLGAAFFACGIAASRALNRRPLLTWWLATALIPAVVGTWWVL
ncbi:hypothetical protein [Nocardioides sp. TF02-7]|uniref:hypothetical protein n=1 Tax=Nocardioides sp. TF02-7 TaxID=2917724 RepID=UPI001F0645D0|nr:hypothetical protein [Nocardioides sp. TF02-7]UMG92364.1 hypothetical protein MF408_21150 [Nocardioides sp. TF02-7]